MQVREVVPPDDAERLRLLIREELQAQSALEELQPDPSILDHLAWALTAQIGYGFEYRWAPKWVAAGDPHRWTEAGGHMVECLACGRTTAHSREDAARHWYAEHRSEHD